MVRRVAREEDSDKSAEARKIPSENLPKLEIALASRQLVYVGVDFPHWWWSGNACSSATALLLASSSSEQEADTDPRWTKRVLGFFPASLNPLLSRFVVIRTISSIHWCE